MSVQMKPGQNLGGMDFALSVRRPKTGRRYRTRIMKLFLILLLPFVATRGLANEPMRPRSAEELGLFGPITTETASFVPGSRVAWADYARLMRDFPDLPRVLDLSSASDESLKDSDHLKLDQWLLSHFAFVGTNQKILNGVRQTPIPEDPTRTQKAYRPKGWIRSAILEVKNEKTGAVLGMIDVKGFGHGEQSSSQGLAQQVYKLNSAKSPEEVDAIRTQGHSDGLMSFGEAGAEVTRQRAIQALFESMEIPLETVESYALIELPFQIYKEAGRTLPAALCLRQAHFGRLSDLHLTADSVFVDPFGKKQGTASLSIVDFGGALLTHSALSPHFSYDESHAQKVGREIIPDAQYSTPWAWSHEAAQSAQESAMRTHIAQMDEAVRIAIQTHPKELQADHHYNRHVRSQLAHKVEKELRSSGKPLEQWPESTFIGILTSTEAAKSTLAYLNLLLNEGNLGLGVRKKLFQVYFEFGKSYELAASVTLLERILSDPSIGNEVKSDALVALGNWAPQRLQDYFKRAFSSSGLALADLAGLIDHLGLMNDPSHLETLLASARALERRAEELSQQLREDKDGRKALFGAFAFNAGHLVKKGIGTNQERVEVMRVILGQLSRPGKEKAPTLRCLEGRRTFFSIADRWSTSESLDGLTPSQQRDAAASLAEFYVRCGSFGFSVTKKTESSAAEAKLGSLFEALLNRLIPDGVTLHHGALSDQVLFTGVLLNLQKAKAQAFELARVTPWKDLRQRVEAFTQRLDPTCDSQDLLGQLAEKSLDDESYERLTYSRTEAFLRKIEAGDFRPTDLAIQALSIKVRIGDIYPENAAKALQQLKLLNTPAFLAAILQGAEEDSYLNSFWSDLAKLKIQEFQGSTDSQALKFVSDAEKIVGVK